MEDGVRCVHLRNYSIQTLADPKGIPEKTVSQAKGALKTVTGSWMYLAFSPTYVNLSAIPSNTDANSALCFFFPRVR